MKSETTDKPGRVACYMRVGTKEQLSPKQRAAMFPDESKDDTICGELPEPREGFSLSFQR